MTDLLHHVRVLVALYEDDMEALPGGDNDPVQAWDDVMREFRKAVADADGSTQEEQEAAHTSGLTDRAVALIVGSTQDERGQPPIGEAADTSGLRERLYAEIGKRLTDAEVQKQVEYAGIPLQREPDHATGCDVFRIGGEPRHCDCGFALWDAKRRGVYNWTPPESHLSCLGCGASGDRGPTYCAAHGDWLCEPCVNAIRQPFGDPKEEKP
jgi:hypothetical protein